MVGQAAEGLGTNDVLVPGPHQLDHLGGEEPALTHFVAGGDDAVRQLHQLPEGQGRVEAVVLQDPDHHLLHALDVVQDYA